MLQKRSVMIIASILLAIFFVWRAEAFYRQAFHGFAWDFAINRTAAIALLHGDVSLYDHDGLRGLAVATIDSGLADRLFRGRFTSFVGLPTTAMLHWPFAVVPFEFAVQVYRVLAVLMLATAVWLTGLALPDAVMRRQAWFAGSVCLLSWQAFPFSVQIGQVDAPIVLCLALGLFLSARQQAAGAGAVIGIAVLLKISPIWLVMYALLTRQWRFAAAALATVAAGILLAAWPQQGNELKHFFTVVLPALGDSPLHPQNQSLGGVFARLFHADNNLLRFDVGIGSWKYAGVLIAAVLLARCVVCGSDMMTGLSLAILAALLAGPLTWDHYLGWAVVPVMVFAARCDMRGWVVLAVVLLPLCYPVQYLKADVIAQGWWWRGATALQTFSLFLLAAGLASDRGTRLFRHRAE